jgi:hypothetical protein
VGALPFGKLVNTKIAHSEKNYPWGLINS